MDAVLVAMSCFALLCQEAEIRCGSDEVTVTYLVPNYHVYLELAQASTVLTTGNYILQIITTLKDKYTPTVISVSLCIS